MTVWNTLLTLLDWLHLQPQWAWAAASPHRSPEAPARWRPSQWLANSGGPLSRVITTPLVSRTLSEGSTTLGLRHLRTCRLPGQTRANRFREFVHKLLQRAGFQTPEQAWTFHEKDLPARTALVVDADPKPDPAPPETDPATLLQTALILGRCSGSIFSPSRPIIWSERRLARAVRLVHCDADTFTHADD